MNLSEALAAFTLQLEADGRSVHTRRQYGRHLTLFGKWLEANGIEPALDQITTQVVARFLTSPMARQTAEGEAKLAATVNALRTSIRCFFQYAELASLVERSPGMLVRRARCGEPPIRALSDDEVGRLLAAASAGTGAGARRDEMLIRLLLATGLRIGEALGIEVEDVDLARAELRVRRAKGDRRRLAFLPRHLQERLAEWVEGREGRLFPISARHAQRQIAALAEAAGIDGASAHSLRHSFACRIYARCGDLGTVREALGHSSIQSTTRYARTTAERVRVAVGA